jgi:hypothetical protein
MAAREAEKDALFGTWTLLVQPATNGRMFVQIRVATLFGGIGLVLCENVRNRRDCNRECADAVLQRRLIFLESDQSWEPKQKPRIVR